MIDLRQKNALMFYLIDDPMNIKQAILFIFLFPTLLQAQYLDEFNRDSIKGWFFFTGDGNCNMDFVQKDGYARILADATNDSYNVWWAIIKNDVSSYLDLGKLQDTDYELRVEARVRVGSAPRRVNFMINTQRTTNYHEHLREYDIPDTTGWYVISMTTKNMDVVPGDTLYVQLGVTDWGHGRYHADIDYYRADIVNVHEAGPDKGEPLIYHPPIPDISTFSHAEKVTQDAVISSDFPDVNFNDWHIREQEENVPVLTIARNQWAILRWDFSQTGKVKAEGAGLLELTTHSVLIGGDYTGAMGQDLGMEFGKIRVFEILGGDPQWKQNEVSYNTLFSGESTSEIVNGQMIYDTEVTEAKGGKTYIPISRPVLQRLLDGTTRGLIIEPLGLVCASFYASEESTSEKGPMLYFNTTK